MISKDDIITHRLAPWELALCKRHAQAAEIGGTSHIRTGEDRAKELSRDQLVGQIGQYVGTHWLTGGHHLYQISRWVANQYPYSGDGGTDIPGANIDFKASRLAMTRPISQHHLLVRPAERGPGRVYVLILVELTTSVAYLVGWAKDADLPSEVEQGGPFDGTHKLAAAELHPLPPLRWFTPTRRGQPRRKERR